MTFSQATQTGAPPPDHPQTEVTGELLARIHARVCNLAFVAENTAGCLEATAVRVIGGHDNPPAGAIPTTGLDHCSVDVINNALNDLESQIIRASNLVGVFGRL